MDSFTPLLGTDKIQDSVTIINENNRTIRSNHSAAGFPFTNVTVGMLHWNTQNSTLYVLSSLGPTVWRALYSLTEGTSGIKGTPMELAAALATTTEPGNTRLATVAEATQDNEASLVSNKALTPEGLSARLGSEDSAGMLKFATSAEVLAKSDSVVLTPATLQEVVANYSGTISGDYTPTNGHSSINGLIDVRWGRIEGAANGSHSVTYSQALGKIYTVLLSVNTTDRAVIEKDAVLVSYDRFGFNIHVYRTGDDGGSAVNPDIHWVAIGT